jgi:hypothetical protein
MNFILVSKDSYITVVDILEDGFPDELIRLLRVENLCEYKDMALREDIYNIDTIAEYLGDREDALAKQFEEVYNEVSKRNTIYFRIIS